jgi:3',5'-nucleoside bisphosphate phosphatase
LIDLHLHTSASDGLCTPAELVSRVVEAGIRTFAVTDHDTMAAAAETAALAARAGLTFVPAIEITSVAGDRDVHVLAYWLDAGTPAVDALLSLQRRARIERARAMAARLAEAGVPIAIDALLAPDGSASGRSIGRPQLARALIEAGHVASFEEAFDRWLADGRPAHLPHQGPSPAEVVRMVADAGGVSSLAHPGLLQRDAIIPSLAEAGLMALEACHSNHPPEVEAHYRALARRLGLAISGGSDYHGEATSRADSFGKVGLTDEEFAALQARRRALDPHR